jgi:hypothetical protein
MAALLLITSLTRGNSIVLLFTWWYIRIIFGHYSLQLLDPRCSCGYPICYIALFALLIQEICIQVSKSVAFHPINSNLAGPVWVEPLAALSDMQIGSESNSANYYTRDRSTVACLTP